MPRCPATKVGILVFDRTVLNLLAKGWDLRGKICILDLLSGLDAIEELQITAVNSSRRVTCKGQKMFCTRLLLATTKSESNPTILRGMSC